MRGALVLIGLLLLAGSIAPSSAQSEDAEFCTNLVLLVHHPYPDSADPLGINWQNSGQDAYFHRYQHLDAEQDGFDFPHVVFDGIVAIEGLPDSSAPYVSTRDAYESAYENRLRAETPVRVAINAATEGDVLVATIDLASTAPLDLADATLYVAAVEDPVRYAPPPALSNGVTVHPFVVRAMSAVDAPNLGTHIAHVPTDPEWDLDNVFMAAWLQQGAVDGLRFDAHEVLQSGLAPVDGSARGDCGADRAVLMEMYSATWCDTCLFGDRVAEEMAERAGILGERTAPPAGYLQNVGRALPWIALALAAGGLVAWRRLPGEKP